MLFLFKYRFLQMIRETSVMFWALAFPLILATLFHFSFGSAGLSSTGESEWDSVRVSVIEKDMDSAQAKAFAFFLDAMDGDTLEILSFDSEEDALHALKEETISGIYYIQETPSLTVGKNGLNESILTSILDSYNQGSAASIREYRSFIQEKSLGGETLDPGVQYFFALIAYAAMSGVFLGIRATFDSQANLSALGARRSITPTHKMTLILTDMLVLVVIHFLDICILTAYIIQILGVNLGNDLPALLLVNLMGSIIGVTMGLALSSLSKMSADMKMGCAVALSLSSGFLAGLMFGNIKNIIELRCPIINRINPAAVLSDAYYCMGVYQDTERFTRSLLILGGMSVLFLLLAFLGIRRKTYESI